MFIPRDTQEIKMCVDVCCVMLISCTEEREDQGLAGTVKIHVGACLDVSLR